MAESRRESEASAESEPELNIPLRPWVKPIGLYTLAVVVILFFVWIFTREAWFGPFNLEDKGTLGDAVNGLTAPIIALISAGLLFYSFQAQVKANKLIQAQWQYDSFNNAFKEMRESFNICGLTYSIFDGDMKTATGKEALQIITQRPQVVHTDSKKEFFADLDSCLVELNVLIERSKRLEVGEAFYLKSKIIRFYRYKLGLLFNQFINELEKNPQQVSHLLKTAKAIKENMKSIGYIEFAVQGQEEFGQGDSN